MDNTLGTRIRIARRRKGMTQEELANCLFMNKQTVSEYENNHIDIKCSIIREISIVLGTTSGYLIDGLEMSDEKDKFIYDIILLLRQINNMEFKTAALEQIRILVNLEKSKK